MKFIVIALFSVLAFAAAQPAEYDYESARYQREASPQGSVDVSVHGPVRRPNLDVDYKQRVYDRNSMTADVFGGLSKTPGSPTQQHLGAGFERKFGNDGFIRGQGQVSRMPGGRHEPSFGISGGWRFRRDIDELADEESQY